MFCIFDFVLGLVVRWLQISHHCNCIKLNTPISANNHGSYLNFRRRKATRSAGFFPQLFDVQQSNEFIRQIVLIDYSSWLYETQITDNTCNRKSTKFISLSIKSNNKNQTILLLLFSLQLSMDFLALVLSMNDALKVI